MLKKLFFLVWSNIVILGFGQTPDSIFNFAHSQYLSGDYEIALKEYQRYLFFERDAEPFALQAIADCYRKLEHFEKAAEYYDRVFYSTTSDSLQQVVLFNKAECEIQLKEFGLSLVDLLAYSDSVKGEAKLKLMFLCGICYFGMEDFAMAENSFIQALGPNHDPQIKEIQQIFKTHRSFYSPNPKTAYILSAFLPGLGQFYSGDIKNGINSFLLTSVLAAVGIRIAIHQTIGDAVITIFPWFQRYYQGGLIRSESIAIDKRKQNRAEAFSQIIDVIASSKE